MTAKKENGMNLYQHPKLLEALERYVREQDCCLPNEEELAGVTFSAAFRQRIRRMIARRRWGYYPLFGTAGRRAASIVVALLAASTIVTMSVDALREPVLRFFAEVYEKFTAVFVVNDTPARMIGGMERYAPTYVPDGYEPVYEEKTERVYDIVYQNADGEMIKYSQFWGAESRTDINTEGTNHIKIVTHDQRAVIHSNHGMTTLSFWKYNSDFSISGTLSKQELLKIAESIEKIE